MKGSDPADDCAADRSGSGSETDDRPATLSRRGFLAAGGGALTFAAGAKAIDNVYLGYGQFGRGTNLIDQDLDVPLGRYLRISYDETFDGTPVMANGNGVTVEGESTERFPFDRDETERVRDRDPEFGLDGHLVGIYEDGRLLAAGEYGFEYHQPEAFFDRIDSAEARPDAVAAVRGTADRSIDPGLVAEFTGVDPADPLAVVDGLMDGFRAHSHYDVARYLAGSIEDNVIFRAHDLRQYFESPVDYESLLQGGSTGMFCGEYVDRSREALQAVGPWDQTAPVAACHVVDYRHKHAYTGIVSAVWDDGLMLPVTFIDYTRSTLRDDFHIRSVTGEGLAAYDADHRADYIRW